MARHHVFNSLSVVWHNLIGTLDLCHPRRALAVPIHNQAHPRDSSWPRQVLVAICNRSTRASTVAFVVALFRVTSKGSEQHGAIGQEDAEAVGDFVGIPLKIELGSSCADGDVVLIGALEP